MVLRNHLSFAVTITDSIRSTPDSLSIGTPCWCHPSQKGFSKDWSLGRVREIGTLGVQWSKVNLAVGTQGIVRSVDKWGRDFSVWTAEPWTNSSDGNRTISRISDFTAVRILPFLSVPAGVRQPTLKSLLKDEQENQELLGELGITPDFLKIQRILNKLD